MSLLSRISTLVLTAGMLVSSIGIPVNRHFCMNRLKDVKLFTEAESCLIEAAGVSFLMCQAETSSAGDDNDCCKDTRELVKIDNAQNQISQVELDRLFPVYVPVSFSPVLIYDGEIFSPAVNNYHKPPPVVSLSKRVEFHSLLI
ncbi:MAG TPA: hypothetical protein VI583_08945 [Cyclobacteriaceae bacterium]|nr:hypothetical protein [Cyclobacteriaceae bacterium]